MKRPKDIIPDLWEIYIDIAESMFYLASVKAIIKSIDWNLYPLDPKKALAVEIGNTIEYGKVVKPMDKDILYVLS